MADDVEFSLDGLDSILEKFKIVDNEVKRKTGRAALRKAAKVVQEAAIENAKRIDRSETEGAIYQNIAIRWNGRLFKRTENLGFRVGVMGGARGFAKASGELKGSGKGNPGGDTYYWRFVEFGTKSVQARPFMRPALESNIAKATTTFSTEFEKGLQRAIKRAAKGK